MLAMTKRSVWDVMVVGRGPVGAVAALGLAQRGFSVALIGARDAPVTSAWDPEARVVALSPASIALLRALRIWDAVSSDRVAPVYDMRVFAGAHPRVSEMHLDAYAGCVESLASIIDLPALMRPLHEALRFAGVQIQDDQVVGLEAEPPGCEGRVAVRLKSGVVLQARLLVAADGADSAVRTLSGIHATTQMYPQCAMVASWQTALPHADTAWQWFDEALGVLALLPLPSPATGPGRVSMVWSVPEALAPMLAALSPEGLAERVTLASQAVLGTLSPLGGVRSFPLRLVRVARMIGHRVVLVGDAAHVMHPLAGQGLNMGMGDVACLLQVLDAREHYREIGDVLLWRRYERARGLTAARMQAVTDGLQRLFRPLPWPLGSLRDWGWRAVSASTGLKRHLIAQAVQF